MDVLCAVVAGKAGKIAVGLCGAPSGSKKRLGGQNVAGAGLVAVQQVAAQREQFRALGHPPV